MSRSSATSQTAADGDGRQQDKQPADDGGTPAKPGRKKMSPVVKIVLVVIVAALVVIGLTGFGGLVGVLKLLQLNRQGGGGSITREAGQTSRSMHGGPATGQLTWSTEPSS